MNENCEKEIDINQKFEELKLLIIDKDKDNASIEALNAVHKRLGKIEKDIATVVEWFGHMSWSKTAILYIAGAVVTLGSALFMIKQLFDVIKK